jgi:hypothetical protein
VKIATREWVTNYVARSIEASRAELAASATVTTSNGFTVVEAGSGQSAVRLVYQNPADAALEATNCTAAAQAQGVTNGCVFVWNGAGAYINPRGVVSCTATNLVYSGVASVHTNGVERFAGLFDARGVLIQPQTSFAITNGMTEVEAHQ